MDYINENPETLREMARAAYVAGATERADMLEAIADLIDMRDAADEVETLADWEKYNGPAAAYKEFFFDCFERLDGHYPAPSVTSDYDCSVIFDAIAGVTQ